MLRILVRFSTFAICALALALVHGGRYLLFYVLCMFRPFVGMMLLAAIVMFPMSIAVFAHPEAARGMPFWAFGLMGIGFIMLAVAYALFVDWIAPPGAADPFARSRRAGR